MSFNYGMGGMMNGMSGMPGMGNIGGMNNMMGDMNPTGNVWQHYKNKYGCEDCFSYQPNFFSLHSQVSRADRRIIRPNILERILNRLGC